MTGGIATDYAGTSGGVLNIYGGTMHYIDSYEGGVCNLFGQDLIATFTGISHRGYDWAGYTLSGHLMDGSDISGCRLETAAGGSFSITNTPEPATLSLLALGGLALVRRVNRCRFRLCRMA